MATSAATTVAAASTTSAATGTVFGFADAGRSSTAVSTIEVLDRGFAGFPAGKGDKGESTGSSRIPVQGHVEIDDGFVIGKELT